MRFPIKYFNKDVVIRFSLEIFIINGFTTNSFILIYSFLNSIVSKKLHLLFEIIKQ